ncbi:MAG: hypothetical protein EA350_10010 [Gemmatimonadales bacterium]|nr:MAG: hypothetical protein EA350_10010 [Gemmatimonadales bacterium]
MNRQPKDPVDGQVDRPDHPRAPVGMESVVREEGRPAAAATASVPDLLRKLSSEGSELVRQEIALVRAEMLEKVDTVKRNLGAIAAGAGLLLAGLLFALWALNTGVTAALVQVVDAEIAVWLAPLILAVLLLAVGWGLVSKGKDAIAEEGLTPERSRESLRTDKRWAEQKITEAREEVTR